MSRKELAAVEHKFAKDLLDVYKQQIPKKHKGESLLFLYVTSAYLYEVTGNFHFVYVGKISEKLRKNDIHDMSKLELQLAIQEYSDAIGFFIDCPACSKFWTMSEDDPHGWMIYNALMQEKSKLENRLYWKKTYE